jgi:hypothetical protein
VGPDFVGDYSVTKGKGEEDQAPAARRTFGSQTRAFGLKFPLLPVFARNVFLYERTIKFFNEKDGKT